MDSGKSRENFFIFLRKSFLKQNLNSQNFHISFMRIFSPKNQLLEYFLLKNIILIKENLHSRDFALKQQQNNKQKTISALPQLAMLVI